MDYRALLLFLVTAANLFLGLAVYFRNPRNRQYIYYFAFASSIALWTLTNGLYQIFPPRLLLSMALLSYASAILMATFFLLFNREFTKIKLGPDWLILLVGGLMALVALKPGVLASSIAADRSIVTTPGIAVMAILLVGFLSWGLLLLVASLRRARGLVRTQLQFMLAGMTTAALMGVLFNLALPVMGHIYTYVYLGPDFTTFYVAAIAYSVIRQRLFNLRVAIARTIAYLLVLTAMAGMYIAAILSITSYFLPSGRISGSQNLISTVVAIVLVFTFQPLRRFFERVTDSVFYRDRYDSQVVLNEFSKVLVSELDLDRILRRSLSQLCRDVHIQFGQLVIFNQDRVYRVEHFGPLPKRLMVAPELRRLDESLLVADELEAGERKTIMDEHAVRVSVRLATRDEFVGYLLLGDKLSGDIYSNQDIELLEIIGKELAVAILNAKAYAEIEAFNRTLQERVDHATNRLRVANRHLKELDKAKDEFISMASHQLRTPLTTIKGYLSMMLEGDAGRLTAAQKQFAGYAFSSSERMVNLISDLLNVSRLSAGRFLIQTKPTDMVAMVADEVRQLQSHAAAKHISLIFEQPPADFPLVEIDENKTRQVIMNFIDNAIYYTQTGSVRVRLTLAGPIVRLEVIDTGIGVPAAEKRHLFTKFYRAENAQVVRPDGTGLGLYLAKRVVEDQDGTILFSSTEGKGSVFGFELPIKPRHKSAPKSANDKQKENQHG